MDNKVTILEKARFVLEAVGDSEPTGKIEALVTTWGARETADGRRMFYKPEGFADWMKDFHESQRPLPMYFNHESNDIPVGEWNGFEVTDEGLVGKGRVYLNTQAGKDIYGIMKESPNMFDGVSVGAYAEEARYVDEDDNEFPKGPNGNIYSHPQFDDEAYFQITKGGLQEVSIVTHAANPQAKIGSLEFHQEDGSIDARKIEKALREAGASKSVATAAVSIFKKVLAEKIEEAKPTGEPETPAVEEAQASDAVDALLEAIAIHQLNKKLSERKSK